MATTKAREEYETELTIKLRSIGFSLERTLFGSWVAFHPLGDKIKLKNLEAVEALYQQQTSSGRGFKRGAKVKSAQPTITRTETPWQRQGDSLSRTLAEYKGDTLVHSIGVQYRIQPVVLSQGGSVIEPLDPGLASSFHGFVRESLTIDYYPALAVDDGYLALWVRPRQGEYQTLLVNCTTANSRSRLTLVRDADHQQWGRLLASDADLECLLVGRDKGVLLRFDWYQGAEFESIRQQMLTDVTD